MALTKTDIYEELDEIIRYMDGSKGNDELFGQRMARGVTRLEKLRDKIKRDVHE